MISETSARLLGVVQRVIGPPVANALTRESRLLDNGFLDSMGLIQLVGDIDAEFGISLRTEDLIFQNFGSVDEIASLVEGYLAEGR
jgi:acyl carrier protein